MTKFEEPKDWTTFYLGIEPSPALRRQIAKEMAEKGCDLPTACRPYSMSLTAIEDEGLFSINGERLTKEQINEKYGHRPIIYIH